MQLRRIALMSGTTLGLIALGMAAFASDPPSQDGSVPTQPGEQVVLTWTGTVPPGAEQSGTCDPAVSDIHEITLAVPDGLYDGLRIKATAAIVIPDGTTDAIITVVKPDGETVSQDSGFIGVDEAVGFGNPQSGTYQILACAFVGGGDSYEGTFTLEGQELTDPNAVPDVTCAAPSEGMTFESAYIDETRAGGEPIVTTLSDGTLLWGSHAGTTHFFGPAAPSPETAAFIENYEGQTYQYYSEDAGLTWNFVPRTPINADPLAGLPNSGFSDPEFAIDAAGNVYISEINLVNVAVSKSSDGGRSYTLQSLVDIVLSDRQWMAADAEDVLYVTANGVGAGGPTPGGHFLIKSTDGGASFTPYEYPNPDGVADIQVDPSDGTLYEITASGDGTLSMAAFRNIRNQESGFDEGLEHGLIADGVGFSAIGRLIDPTFDMDAEGNLYIVWTENGEGSAGRNAGIWFSYSTDRGRTWLPPLRVDPDERADAWPWLTVGAPGQVAINWLGTDAVLEDNNAELAEADDAWHVITAHAQFGSGCSDAAAPAFRLSQATADDEPVHFGTICQGGTLCQAEVVDRRLGDYFANEVDGNGHLYVSVSDTRQGGAVSLPRILRQTGGPNLFDQPVDVAPTCVAEANPDGSTAVERIDVNVPSTIAVALSAGCFESADTVLLARDDVFADALAAAGLAGEFDAPVLLTRTDELLGSVADELERLGATEVVVAGGPVAISEEVVAELGAMGIATTRIGGPERFSTAGLIGDAIVEAGGPVNQVILALGTRPEGGDAWPDALAAGVLSATGRAPVLLSNPDDLTAPTQDALQRILGDSGQVFVAGGVDAVGPEVEAGLEGAGYTTERLAGPDRYATAVAVVEEAIAQGAEPGLVMLASGEEFAGALVAGPAAVHAGGVMLLVHPDDLANGAATGEFLSAHAEAIERVLIAGGAATISDAVVEQVRALLAPD